MRINKKDFSNYLGISQRNIGKHYQAYLDILGIKKRNWLTVFDVAKVDDIEPKEVGLIMGFDRQNMLILDKIGQSKNL